MDQDPLRMLKRVAAQLHTLRDDPAGYTLLVGNEASRINGRPFMEALQAYVLQDPAWGVSLSDDELIERTVEQRTQEFEDVWQGASLTIRNHTLRNLRSKISFTKGHEALAILLQQHYFPLLLTTTIDNVIEQCFYKLFGGEESNGQLVVVSNSARGFDAALSLSHSHAWRGFRASIAPDPIIFNLYGRFPHDYAVTHNEIEAKASALRTMDDLLSGDLLILGFTHYDEDTILNIPDQGGHVYFIGTEEFFDKALLKRLLRHRSHTFITDESFTFDFVLQTIGNHLNIFKQLEDLYGRRLDREAVSSIENSTGGDEAETIVEIVRTLRVSPTEEQNDTMAPVASPVKTSRFTVTVDTNKRLSFQTFNYGSVNAKEWDINEYELNAIMQDLGKNIEHYHHIMDRESLESWRMRAKREEINLYKSMLQAQPDLGEKLALARKPPLVDSPEELTLIFQGPRSHLGMPYELLHDGSKPLAVSHPLCRQVLGIEPRYAEDLNTFVLHYKKPIKVLLIASDNRTASCNEEVVALGELIRNRGGQLNLQINTRVVRTEEASLKNVRSILRGREKYHIVHYAGHAYFDAERPENSGLLFWSQEKRRGVQEILSARELASLFSNNETRLFYLSTCVGATIGSENQLLRNDYLGIMDALVRAGIPYVLGFRWYVTARGSYMFARSFYEQLLQWPMVPERAALHARRELYDQDGNDETWTSPIVVAQTPYAR